MQAKGGMLGIGLGPIPWHSLRSARCFAPSCDSPPDCHRANRGSHPLLSPPNANGPPRGEPSSFGGQGRNRTTDTRIFNVGCVPSGMFQAIPNLLISIENPPTFCPAQFSDLPALCVVFDAGLHRNYTDSDRSSGRTVKVPPTSHRRRTPLSSDKARSISGV